MDNKKEKKDTGKMREEYFAYAYWYGETAARRAYGAWAPQVGTINPYGVNKSGIIPEPHSKGVLGKRKDIEGTGGYKKDRKVFRALDDSTLKEKGKNIDKKASGKLEGTKKDEQHEQTFRGTVRVSQVNNVDSEWDGVDFDQLERLDDDNFGKVIETVVDGSKQTSLEPKPEFKTVPPSILDCQSTANAKTVVITPTKLQMGGATNRREYPNNPYKKKNLTDMSKNNLSSPLISNTPEVDIPINEKRFIMAPSIAPSHNKQYRRQEGFTDDHLFHGGQHSGQSFEYVRDTDGDYINRCIVMCYENNKPAWSDLCRYMLFLVRSQSKYKEDIFDLYRWSNCNFRTDIPEEVRDEVLKRPEVVVQGSNWSRDSEIQFQVELMGQVKCEPNESSRTSPLWLELLHNSRVLLIEKGIIMAEDDRDLVDTRMKNCYENIRRSIEKGDAHNYNLFFKEMMYYIQWNHPLWMELHYKQMHKTGFRVVKHKQSNEKKGDYLIDI